MLPQVATHIIHHTSRAVAAVHNQTTQAIRNAWQFQQTTPSASSTTSGGITGWGGVGSSSGWGGSSTGPGGAKYNAGSRFYSGYTGPGRSITQANQTSAQPDDNDEPTIVRIQPAPTAGRKRPRSSSLSLPAQGRLDRGERLGVLKVVQMRARHAFATSPSVASLDSNELPQPTEVQDRPVLVRRNSTSTHSVASSDVNLDLPPPPPPPLDSLRSDPDFVPNRTSSPRSGSTIPVETVDIDPSDLMEPQSESWDEIDRAAYRRLYAVASSHNYEEAVNEVQHYRARSRVTVPCYNMALHALSSCRSVGQPITFILELYNEMLARNLMPNHRTYKIVINACCARDVEIQRVITTLENRISRRSFTTGSEDSSAGDQERATRLRAENNFSSALTLFQAATTAKNAPLGVSVYNTLLRSCAYHDNVEAAIRVFSHMERFPEEKPAATTYYHLMTTYYNVADFNGAREVFEEFKRASSEDRINWDWSDRTIDPDNLPDNKMYHIHDKSGRLQMARCSQVNVWNRMIDSHFKAGDPAGALVLLESMLDTKNGEAFTPTDPPLPNTITFTSILLGFCNMGDWKSALSWFDRLLQQPKTQSVLPWEPLPAPPRPDHVAWIAMIDSLARAGAVDELNRMFALAIEIMHEDNLHIRTIDHYSVFRANLDVIRAPETDPTRAEKLVDFLVKNVVVYNSPKGNMVLTTSAARSMLLETVHLLVERNKPETALDIVEQYVANETAIVREAEAARAVTGSQVMYHSKGVRGMIQSVTRMMLLQSYKPDSPVTVLPFKLAIRLATVSENVGLKPQGATSPWYIHSYAESRKLDEPPELSQSEWAVMLDAFIAEGMPPMDGLADRTSSPESKTLPPGYVSPGLKDFLFDMSRAQNIDPEKIITIVRNKVAKVLVKTHGLEEAGNIIKELGPRFANLALPGWGSSGRGTGYYEAGSTPNVETSPPASFHVDLYHSRFVDEWYPTNPHVSPSAAYQRLLSGVERSIYPSPETIGRLIAGLGRAGEVTKVRLLYDIAQDVLAALEGQKRWQSAGWFVVEDQMIVALAHAGEYEAANVHRARIIEHGGTPSSDAYGALISSTKDTTDDVTGALALWEEAMSRDVRANTYLYNTIISKLSKARKADHALIIFRQMKSDHVKPSSITFGALISACCRVGDSQSAEHLFHEMTSAPNFKPRVPPYNTMIQFYTYTKPNRERVLYFYNALLAAGVKPTAHTYKLLLEAYGTIQPIDLASMEDIFKRISASNAIEVNGAHWGALINAYGCASKDLDRAIEVFESIVTHPATSRSSTRLPDAIAYEALFAVFSQHRRADLLQTYLQRLRNSDIHPTAYVVNAVIRGYAAAGDLKTAREIFEDLQDPPMGVAAPHNHAPHEHQNRSEYIPPGSPVYREPSTWEAMVRAELGISERERALDLIKRMEARQYPPAVVQRVRDIMHTDGSETPPSSMSSISPSD